MQSNLPIWDDRTWTPQPPLSGDGRVEVCVVGLGGSGLAALEELRELGIRAAGIDAREVGAGAAGRNGGFILAGLAKFYHETVAQFGREIASEIYRATTGEIRRQALAMPGVFRLQGSLRLAADATELSDCQAHADALRADGFPVELYRGPEGEGLLLPTDGSLQPLMRVRRMAARLLSSGVPLYENSPVLDLAPGRVVTSGGTLECGAVVVAVDGRLEKLLPELAPRVRTARLQMLGTAPAPEVVIPRPVYWRQGFEYWQQLPDRTVALGGFRDRGLEQEWTSETEPTALIQGLQEEFLRRHLRVRAPITHRWAASVSYTTDGLPVLEQVRPGIWAAGAYSGTGNIIGALCGRAAARLATGRESKWARLLDQARGRSASGR